MASTQNERESAPEAGAFKAQWKASDAAFLQPSNITIPRAAHAWERRPLSPFSRQKLRVGKVWKRSIGLLRNAPSIGEAGEQRASKRARRRGSPVNSLRPVKKMCFETDFGMGVRVQQWEGSESPVRKIVTRSNAATEDIIALPDPKEDEEVAPDEDGDITVEILDEDGTVLDVGGEHLAKSQDWEDEIEDEADVDDDAPFDPTMMHLVDIASFANGSLHANFRGTSRPDSPLKSDMYKPTTPLSAELAREDKQFVSNDSSVEAEPTIIDLPETVVLQRGAATARQDSVLPEGFVSPVKRPPIGRRAGRLSGASRRRTLPIQFAPSPLKNVMSVSSIEEDEATLEETYQSVNYFTNDNDLASEAISNTTEVDQPVPDVQAADQGWEDVEDDDSPIYISQGEPSIQDMSQMGPDNEPMTEDHTLAIGGNATTIDEDASTYFNANNDATKAHDVRVDVLPSDLVPTIESPRQVLPLRRSPRRQSSSPFKKQTTLPSTEKSHLIAFTPIKGFGQPTWPSYNATSSNTLVEPDDEQLEAASPVERAASAPPEEPQMSPHRPSRPRVSDDTALLQAFLNRAAESKSSRWSSTSRRESLSRREDRDAVRQALASPAKTDVLRDLDTNSPSPRKPFATRDDVCDSGDQNDDAQQDDVADDLQQEVNTRRSGRSSRKGQTPASSPNKISIRGNSGGVVLRNVRTEAQEVALLTRNNTRKNKGGAILPPLRLNKIRSGSGSGEVDASEDADNLPVEQSQGKRRVRWAETLVEFQPGGEVSEVSVLSDELNEPTQHELAVRASSESKADGPPPPSETPSKPKMRRLKSTRTASTPGKAPPPALEMERLSASDAAPPPSSQEKGSRRSRIATPAKGLRSSSMLSMDTDPPSMSSVSAEDKRPAPKKKAATSKLPAPAPSTISALGQGKENLISSPPKKRTVPTSKTFAPKLDFSKAQLQPAGADAVVPGLASPAKKGRSQAVLFGASTTVPDLGPVIRDDRDRDRESKRDELPPGLNSPAKKRTRRAVYRVQ